jgi:hypothetical protein
MSNIAKGGKALYGAPLGILMLEARFAVPPACCPISSPRRKIWYRKAPRR